MTFITQIRKVLWIYLLAFVLAAFSFHAESKAADKEKKAEKKSAKTDSTKGKEVFALFETTQGNFKVKLFAEQAPNTVANFVGLAEGTKEFTDPKTNKKTKRHYYDGLIFHRVIPGFMIQGGDPEGTGGGGPGFTIKDEIHPDLNHNKAGILSMAKTQMPDSGGSQFFITVAPTRHLNGIHTVFGEVVEGYDIVEKISKVATARGDRPLEPVVMKTVKIVHE